MPGRLKCVVTVGAGLAVALVASAQGRPDPGADGATSAEPYSYLTTGSEYDYAVVLAPLPAKQLGRIALAATDRVRAHASPSPEDAGVAAADPPVLGVVPPGIPPPEWPLRVSGPLAKRGAADFAGRLPRRKDCRCATEIGDTTRERVAVLYASRSFEVGTELGQLEVLRLKVRYRDGLLVYINGREVARRNMAPDATPMAVASRSRGPEWETFYVPVVPGLLSRGDNQIAFEVRPSGRSLSPTLDAELAAAAGARLVRGPMVQRVGPTSAVIQFDTDLPTSAAVEYRTAAESGLVAHSAGGSLAVHHVVELTGLPAGKAVHYRVKAGGDASAELVFHTAPAAGEPIRFAVYGDVRGGHTVHRELVAGLIKDAPDFALSTGDLVLRGTDEGDWQRFFSVAADLLGTVPLYPAVGNHDMGRSGEEGRRMNEIFALWPGPPDRPGWGHWYAFDVADVHFVMLDSNAYEYEGQLDWLRADLADARKRGVRAIFVVTHHGPYARGPHGGHRYAMQNYAPVLVQHRVTMVFSGHDHLYQRGHKDGLDYIVSGGGGAPLYRVKCGVPGRRKCRVDDGMQHAASEYHYIMITVHRRSVKACAKRPDGTPLEECVTYKLPRRRTRR